MTARTDSGTANAEGIGSRGEGITAPFPERVVR